MVNLNIEKDINDQSLEGLTTYNLKRYYFFMTAGSKKFKINPPLRHILWYELTPDTIGRHGELAYSKNM